MPQGEGLCGGAAAAIRSPYFCDDIRLGFEGFQHLQYSSRGEERSREEQVRRFILLPLARRVLRTATTVQEYRTAARSPRNGVGLHARPPEAVQWWGFVAAFIKQDIKICVVVRKVGKSRLHFWSLMLCPNRRRGNPQRSSWKQRGHGARGARPQ